MTGPLKRDGANGIIAYPKKVVTGLCNGTIALGDAVKVETSGAASPDPDVEGYLWIFAPSAESNLPTVCGVALEAATDGNPVTVQVAGFNNTLTAVDTINVNEAVGGSASGQIRQWDTETAVAQPFAVAVIAYTAGLADGAVLITDKGWFG